MESKLGSEQFPKQLEVLVRILKERIISGEYKLGEYMPSEKKLASEFHMSNNSIRKALEQLEIDNWIEKIPRVGNRVKTTQEPVIITLACNDNIIVHLRLPELLRQFEQLYPWIQVETSIENHIPGFTKDQMENELDPSIDVILLNDLHSTILKEKGAMDQLEELTKDSGIYPNLYNGFRDENKLYGQPIVFSPIVMSYNKQHFRECGIPEPNGSWTWGDLISNAKKLSRNGRYGFYFHLPDNNRWPIFLIQSGESFSWESKRLQSIEGTSLLDSIRLCKELIHNRDVYPLYMSEGDREVIQMFREGKVSMVLSSYFSLNSYEHVHLDYDISPIPFIDEPRTLLIVIGGAIAKHSNNKQEAHLLLDFLTSPEAQSFIRRNTMSIPALQSIADEPGKDRTDLSAPSRYSLYREMLFSYRSHSDLNIPAMSFGDMYKQLKLYWGNLIDEDELCERLTNTITKK